MTTDEQRVQAAEALLYRTLETTDPATGAPVRRRVETPLYRQYLELRAAYEAARAAHAAAHRDAQRTPGGRGSWPLLAATLQLPVQQAHDRWRAAGADRIEQAEALLASSARP